MKIITMVNIDYDELDELIEKELGHSFECVADLEAANDTAQTFKFKKEPHDQWNQKKVDEFKQTGKGSYITRALMQELVNTDKLPEGDYVVKISW